MQGTEAWRFIGGKTISVFNGAMAGGSLAWGPIAQGIGVSSAFFVGAAGVVVACFVLHRFRLPTGEADLVPSHHWPEPMTVDSVEHDRGPVLILIEYHVARDDRAAFLRTLGRLSTSAAATAPIAGA